MVNAKKKAKVFYERTIQPLKQQREFEKLPAPANKHERRGF